MRCKRLFFAAAALLIVCRTVSVYGIPLEELLDNTQAAVLRTGSIPHEVQFGSPKPKLAPGHEGIRLIIEDLRRGLDPSIMAETLKLYAKPAGTASWTQAEQQALFNAAAALSTLKGLQYYSHTRGTLRTFYETSSVIDGPATKKALPDPVYSYLPRELTLFARQKDLSFGDNVYEYDYRTFSDALVFVQQNLTSLSYGIIPAVGKNKLNSLVAVIDAGDSLLIYAVSMAKASSFPGLKDKIGSSFSNRAEAILGWYAAQADKVYKELF